jgi:hypothetical protein
VLGVELILFVRTAGVVNPAALLSLLRLLRLHNSEGSLLGLVARLLQTTGLLGHRGLLARHDTAPLVVLQVRLREPARRVLGSTVHHLGTRPNFLHCATALVVVSHLLPVQKS